jgi:hypothetical protein
VHTLVIGYGAFESKVVKQVSVAINGRVDDNRRLLAGEALDKGRGVDRYRVVETQGDLDEIRMGRVRQFACRCIQRQIDIRNMDRARHRSCTAGIIVGEGTAAKLIIVTADVYIVDVFH